MGQQGKREEKRNKVITVRLTEGERSVIDQLSERLGMTASELVRLLLTDEQQRPYDYGGAKEARDVTKHLALLTGIIEGYKNEFNRIGVNLYQLLRLGRFNDIVDDDVAEQLVEMFNQLASEQERINQQLDGEMSRIWRQLT